jgi:two-component system, chemotaxis family, protein-glutamate methylesterase/glutaminase
LLCKDLVVIGSSAGAIDALRIVLGGMPPDFPGSILIVVHVAADSPAVLPRILAGAGPLPVTNAVHRERLKPGHVYIAPPDHHMIVLPDRIELSRGPRENRFRPAVDPLFRSAAQTYGPRVVGVILTGGLDDGVSGLSTIKKLGGTAIVQDPSEAMVPSMPESALRHVDVDYTVRLAEIPALLSRLASIQADQVTGDNAVKERVGIEVKIASEDKATEAGVLRLGDPSLYACPECHGVLLQIADADVLRFRCHTGHAYSVESLLAEMDEAIEDSLWNAIRALEEGELLARQAAQHLREVHGGQTASQMMELADAARKRGSLVREAVTRGAGDRTKSKIDDEQSSTG